jgi:hypothetical protein
MHRIVFRSFFSRLRPDKAWHHFGVGFLSPTGIQD